MTSKWHNENPEKSNQFTRDWRNANAEKNKQNKKNWIKNNPEKAKLMQRKAALKFEYGLSIEEYDKMEVNQQGQCAICRCVPKDKLCVDHDHKTNKVRGLLCRSCNMAIGKFKEDINNIRAAVAYLEKV